MRGMAAYVSRNLRGAGTKAEQCGSDYQGAHAAAVSLNIHLNLLAFQMARCMYRSHQAIRGQRCQFTAITHW
jgi:hypothetical protein